MHDFKHSKTGMTGEKTIYKRRGETKDSLGQNQQKKKLMVKK